MPTDYSNWKKGAKGEAIVGRELARLRRDRWKVFHDLPLGPGGVNVDHLVVGAPGVFSINTKNLSGKVWLADRALLVNGQKTKYLQASFMEAKNVGNRLSEAVGSPVAVTPTLVIMCEEITRKSEPKDVLVLRRRDLVKSLERMDDAMDLGRAARIAQTAGRASTWA